jgi:DNA processing protein
MRHTLLGLALAEHIGWSTIHRLIVAGVDDSWLERTKAEWLEAFPFLSPKQAAQCSTWLRTNKIEQQEDYFRQKGILYITAEDDDYPQLLREINKAPWTLFTLGYPDLLHQPSLAVVGSRKTSVYGRSVTRQLTLELVRAGWTITSGLALGIDGLAHETALQSKGATIAVLGCGIDRIYPPQNRRLYETIAREGLIVSEYQPGVKPHPGLFPQRNRIIAGLTYGTVVTEAAQKSGSLLTAHLAQESGREVFAFPGSVFDESSLGTNLLIQRHGAKLITNAQDVLDELQHLGIQPPVTEREKERLKTTHHADAIERHVLELLKTGKMHVNDLHKEVDTDFGRLSTALIKLEMKQLVQSLPGSYYQKNQPVK